MKVEFTEADVHNLMVALNHYIENGKLSWDEKRTVFALGDSVLFQSQQGVTDEAPNSNPDIVMPDIAAAPTR